MKEVEGENPAVIASPEQQDDEVIGVQQEEQNAGEEEEEDEEPQPKRARIAPASSPSSLVPLSSPSAASAASSCSRMSVEENDASSAGPQLCHFVNGLPDLDSGDVGFQLLANDRNPQKTVQRILYAENDVMEWFAKNFGSDSSARSPRKYAIGLFDSSVNHLTMTEALHIYQMKQHVKGFQSKMPADDGEDEEESFWSKKVRLVETFGSKMSQRAVRSIISRSVRAADDETQRSLELAKEQGQASAASLLATRASASSVNTQLLPHFNLEAKTPADAFDVNSIFTEEEWTALDNDPWLARYTKALATPSEFKTLCDASAADPLPALIRHHLWILRKVHDHEEDEIQLTAKRLVALTYLLLLQRHKNIKSPRQLQSLLGCPEFIANKLLGRFYERILDSQSSSSSSAAADAPSGPKHVFHQTELLRDKLFCYLLILLLFLSDFVIDQQSVKALAQDFQLAPSDLAPFFYQIGCKASKEAAGRGSEDKRNLPRLHHHLRLHFV